MTTAFEDWADWQTLKGVPAVVKTVSWIDENYSGIDRPEKIREFIKDAAAYWGTDFVLLGGDIAIVPPRFLGGPESWGGFMARPDPPGDLYYGELDATWNDDGDAYFADDLDDLASDEYCDVWVGRLPVRDALEAALVLDKIATYVRQPGQGGPSPDPGYYDDVLVAAEPTNAWCTGPGYGLNGIEVAGEILDILRDSAFEVDTLRLYPRIPVRMPSCEARAANVQCFETTLRLMHYGPDERLTAEIFADSLDNGKAYVFHVGHSIRDMLGCLSKEAVNKEYADCDCSDEDTPETWTWHDICRNALKNDNPGWERDLSKEMVDDLTNGPEYSVVVSIGSYTNQFDLDSVSEHFLRNPSGGAVAYFGKSASTITGDEDCAKNFFANVFHESIVEVGMVCALATDNTVPAGGSGNRLRPGINWRLLGDPEMPLWTKAPGTLLVSHTPQQLLRIGTQTIEVEVTDSIEEPVEGARVCLKQGDHAYAVAWTRGDGKATFPSFTPLDQSDISVVTTARNFIPEQTSIQFNQIAFSPAFVTYSGHDRDDSVEGGDGDGVLEAGETVYLTVTMENTGDYAATGVGVELWPTAPIDFTLTYDGAEPQYRPERIYIGAEAAHPPPAVADTTFRMPANWHAIRPESEGEPNPGATLASHVLIWRDMERTWHLKAKFPMGGSEDLSGTLVTQGGFNENDVEWIGLEGEDTGEVVGDTLRFTFTPAQMGDADAVEFLADAYEWLTVVTDEVDLGTMQAQETKEAEFQVDFDESAPDLEEVVFTLVAEDDAIPPTRWFSEFSETIQAPRTHYLSQQIEIGHYDQTSFLNIYPTLSNLGSAVADSSIAYLSSPDPEYTVIQGVTTFGACAPGDTLSAYGYFTMMCNDPPEGFLGELELRTLYTNGEWTEWTNASLDVVAPSTPENLLTDEGPGSVILRWDPVEEEIDLSGYHIFQELPGEQRRLTREPVAGTCRFEIADLAAFDVSENCIHYEFSLTSVDLSGNESSKAISDSARVWLPQLSDFEDPEAPGWPQRIRGRSRCAPKVFNVDDDDELEIFTAGQAIYAWNHDGSPLIEENADGLFWKPSEPVGTEHNGFVEALAIADLDDDGNCEIVGNLAPNRVYVISYDRTTGEADSVWSHRINAPLSAPILEDLNPVDRDGMELILAGQDGIRGIIYVWTDIPDSPKTFRSLETDHGRFAIVPDSIRWNYRSIAVGDVRSSSAGVEIIQSVRDWADSNHVPEVVCYPTTHHNPTPVWRVDIGNEYAPISTPIIGDVLDTDGLEIVVTRKRKERDYPHDDISGAVARLSELNSGSPVLSMLVSDTFWFNNSQPSPAVVANLRTIDDELEIIVGDGEEGHLGIHYWAIELRIRVFDDDGDGHVEEVAAIEDEIMVPSRKSRDTATSSQPIVGNIDDDDALEILQPTDASYLACYEWNGSGGRPERGWPCQFPDFPLTPTLADVDDNGDLEMVVQDMSGWLHVLDLPNAPATNDLPWPEYGHDPRNTFNATTVRDLGGGGGPPPRTEAVVTELQGLRVGPNPQGAALSISFALSHQAPVRLDVLDVQGRLVRKVVEKVLPARTHQFVWDGTCNAGTPVGSGVYFVRLKTQERVEIRKVSVVR
jgi:hypothetical protein